MTTKKDTFKLVLQRSNKSIQAARANRISAVAKMEYDALVATKKKEVFTIQDELESMSDISTSNITTSSNAIKGSTFDAAGFVKKRAKLKFDLSVVEMELEMLEEDAEFYA